MKHPFGVGQRVWNRNGAPCRVVMRGFVTLAHTGERAAAVGTVPEAMWKRGRHKPMHRWRLAANYRAR